MVHARTLIALVLLLPLANVYASDWRYMGNTHGKDKDEEAMFYDLESIEHPNKDTVRIWTMAISQKAINSYLDKHGLDKGIVDNGADKLLLGYVPEYLNIPAINKHYPTPNPNGETLKDVTIEITSEEYIANSGEVKATGKFYDEIRCSEKQIGFLSIILYNKDGSISSNNIDPPQYRHIPPDSTGQWLSMLVCQKS